MHVESEEERIRLSKLSASMVTKIINMIKRKDLNGQESYLVLKWLSVSILSSYENETILTERLFKDIREGLSELKSYGSFTLQ